MCIVVSPLRGEIGSQSRRYNNVRSPMFKAGRGVRGALGEHALPFFVLHLWIASRNQPFGFEFQINFSTEPCVGGGINLL